MPFFDLSSSEQHAIRETIVAVLISPDLSPSEFHTRYGVDFEVMKKVLRKWPNLDDVHDDDARLTINGCLNEVCYGIAFEEDPDVIGMTTKEWPLWFSLSRDDLRNMYRRWKARVEE